MSDAILLQADGDSAEILPFGAELSAWRADGVDLVWAKDPTIWDQTAPVLFPVVGWTRDGQRHGRGQELSAGAAWLRLEEMFRDRRAARRLSAARCCSTTPRPTRSIPSPSASRSSSGCARARWRTISSSPTPTRAPCPTPAACIRPSAGRWRARRAEHAIVFERRREARTFRSSAPADCSRAECASTRRSTATACRSSREMFARDALCFLNLGEP